MIMTYFFDPETFEYTYSKEMDESQGFPNNVMFDPPPIPGEGEYVVMSAFRWVITTRKPVRPDPIISPEMVDAERDRRTSMGFVYDGKAYQTENQSQIDDILGKMTDSLAAITVDGAEAGNLRWASPDYDFAWSAADGTLVPMDAQTCLAFTRSAVRRKTLLVAAGLALKAMSPIPTDYTDDKYWPPMDTTAKAARSK